MKRSYIYVIVILLTITLVTADYIIGKDLQDIIPPDDTYRTIEHSTVKESNVVGTILIKNEQNTDEKISYDYTIRINGLAGAYRYKYNDKEGYLIFTANGETNFTLKTNESITIYDIPTDLSYIIKQQTKNDKYTVKVDDEETSTYEGQTEQDNVVTFNNSTKVAPKKETKKETEKQPKKETKKEIPNTGETEIRLTLVLLISLLVIICFRKMRIRRFE